MAEKLDFMFRGEFVKVRVFKKLFGGMCARFEDGPWTGDFTSADLDDLIVRESSHDAQLVLLEVRSYM